MVNRIAAGEVIERPAAAVKELVENALDAGATRIAITLEQGGTTRIVVEDDGSGMDAANLALAVERHCTSKLADEALVRITTLGFRGEALPSIGAAARLEITSRPHGAPHGHRIRVEGGRVEPPVPAPAPHGTRVVVSDLFFATPARRKFLKSTRTEADHAEQAALRLAFAAPHVAIRLEIDGATRFDLPVQDRAARVAALLAARIPAAALLPVHATRDGASLTGFAAPASHSAASAAGQSLVVNGRPVADPVLRTALRVAYQGILMQGRHPVAALWLELPHDTLDVNVHPAKTELRFQDPAAIRSLVIGGSAPRSGSAPVRPPRPSTPARTSSSSPAVPPHAPPIRPRASRTPSSRSPTAPPPAPSPRQPPHPTTRSAPPWPSSSTPTSSPSVPTAPSSSSTSTPPMSGSPTRPCSPSARQAASAPSPS